MTAALFCAIVEDSSFGSDDRSSASDAGAKQRSSPPARRAVFDLPHDLSARIRARDPAALEMLMQVALEPLVRFAYGFVRSYDVAEDVVQEVFVRVWARGEDWDPKVSVATYLYAAVRNRALNAVRARTAELRLKERVRTTESETSWMHSAPAGSSPEQLVQWNELMMAFDEALALLTERQRSALVLRFEQGRTIPEIAHVLGISTKAAEKLVSRGVRVLRGQLESLIR